MKKSAALFFFWLLPTIVFGQRSVQPAIQIGSEFAAIDTLACGSESNGDAKACLAGLGWSPTKFTVRLEDAQPGSGDFLVRFPSPRPIGNSTNDLVSMEWFAAHDNDKKICKARAVVVVHESGSHMTVGRMIARAIGGQGLHAFLIHLPGYGARRDPELMKSTRALSSLPQAIADVRRARDAAAALPVVDSSRIGLQGTSLGGFVTSTVAGVDHGYDRIFILLAGGNLQDVVLHGGKDAAKTHAKLAAAGVTDDQIKELVRQIEPLRLAHRIDPEKTWLYSGKFDEVVPPRCSLALAQAAHIPKSHHVEFPVTHYSGALYLPQVIEQIHQQMTAPPTQHHKTNEVNSAR